MSFYGNIQNRLEKFWRFITINGTEIEAKENDTLNFKSQGGIDLSADTDQNVTIDGTGLQVSVTEGGDDNYVKYNIEQKANKTKASIQVPKLVITADNTNTSDGVLTYKVKYGAQEQYLTIPLDLLLNSSEVEYYSDLWTDVNGKPQQPGTYLHLTFKTEEDTAQHCYIDVSALNELAGDDTDTIHVDVDDNSKISASIKPKSITSEYIVDSSIASNKMATWRSYTYNVSISDNLSAPQQLQNVLASDDFKDTTSYQYIIISWGVLNDTSKQLDQLMKRVTYTYTPTKKENGQWRAYNDPLCWAQISRYIAPLYDSENKMLQFDY